MPGYSITEGYTPGALGRVVSLHGSYYAEHWGSGRTSSRRLRAIWASSWAGTKKHGFVLVAEKPGMKWGPEVLEQRFECRL